MINSTDGAAKDQSDDEDDSATQEKDKQAGDHKKEGKEQKSDKKKEVAINIFLLSRPDCNSSMTFALNS